MAIVYPNECEAAGVSVKEVRRIAKGIERYAKEAQKLGMIVFGGSTGTLRFDDQRRGTGRLLVLATMTGGWDGGCGAAYEDENGLLRGE